MKIVFIINPISGGKDNRNIADIIKATVSSNHSYEIIFWEKPDDYLAITERLKKNDYDTAVAAGGDGTVNLVAKCIVNTDKAFGIIPLGSGNGLARHLKIPIEPKAAIGLINAATCEMMDTATVNGNFFLCTSGVGFDAHIGNLFAQHKTRGFLTYLKLTVKEFLNFKAQEYEVTVNEKSHLHTAFLITIANASQYGNNAFIAPNAKVTDGQLDVCVLKPFSLIAAPFIALKLFTKKLDCSKFVQYYKGNSITIKRINEGPIHIDGEPAVEGNTLNYKLQAGSLKVIIKKK